MALTRTAITFGCLAAAMAETVDWRTKGVVPPVKNQGQMGSPSAFALVDVIGMLHILGGGQLVDLSIGEAADCCGKQPMADPLACLVKLGGLCTTADYPRPRGTCVRGTCTPAFPLDGWTSKDMTSVQMVSEKCTCYPLDSLPFSLAYGAAVKTRRLARVGGCRPERCRCLCGVEGGL
jgi:hypothetical protein